MGRLRTTWKISVALSVAALAACGPILVLTSAGPDTALGRAVAVVLVVIQAGSLAWMRSRAERAMAVALATGIGLQALCPQLGVLGLANLALCVYAAVRPPRVSLWALGVVVILSPWVVDGRGTVAWLVAIGGPVLSWSWGELLRSGRERRRSVAQRAMAEERARISRELHDVVAHNVSLMVVQAVAAQDVFDARPDQSRAALGAIEAAGRAALGELRRMLGATDPNGRDDARDPQPGLGELDALVASVRAAGLAVELRREQVPVDLPSGVDLSAYRIVQEALTNTLRHARATRAAVSVSCSPAAVEIDVTDDGRGVRGAPDGGRGILGMRERAALLGGTLDAGGGPRGGFRVHAVLPLGTTSRALTSARREAG